MSYDQLLAELTLVRGRKWVHVLLVGRLHTLQTAEPEEDCLFLEPVATGIACYLPFAQQEYPPESQIADIVYCNIFYLK